MSFVMMLFLGFLVVTAAVSFLTPAGHRWIVLLAASIGFYVIAGSWRFLPFALFTSFAVWAGAKKIGQLNAELKDALAQPGLERSAKKELREKYRRRTRRILVLTLVLCIGILCVTKFTRYAVIYLNRISEALGGGAGFSAAWLIVPLGISYYTFSTVGYLLDVYWKRYDYERSYFRFLLYAIYFPHILQGPISRYNLLGQELKKEYGFDPDRIVSGFQLILWGFFKKMVIADRLSVFIRQVYDGKPHAGSIFLIAMAFDALMIYTDFSGYMDIVQGGSTILGPVLETNFNHPFFSRSVAEFWRRWHMTLGGWFKDYVYYPITVSSWMKKLNRRNAASLPAGLTRVISVAIPCMITWCLTGLWHGTGKTYVMWGIYYGVLITCSVAFSELFEKLNRLFRIRTDTRFFHVVQMLRTFCIFMGGRVLTSPGSLSATGTVLKNLFTNFQMWKWFDGSIAGYGLDWTELFLVFLSLLLLWGVSMLQERGSVRERIARQNIVFRWGLMYLAFCALLLFGVYGLNFVPSSFVYMAY